MEAVSDTAQRLAVHIDHFFAEERQRLSMQAAAATAKLEREKRANGEIMAACIALGKAVDAFKQSKFVGGSQEINARSKLEKAADSLAATMRRSGRLK